MHPLLAGRLRTALYLAIYGVVGAILTGVLMLLTPRPLGHAIAFVLPLTLIYASICLSAWWVCRAHPLATTPALRVVINSVTAAVQAAAVLAALATGWAALLASRFGVGAGHDPTLRAVGGLFFAGLPPYLQSIP